VFHALGLKESLEDERRALENEDLEALDAAVRAKSSCVGELQRLDRERSELASSAGFGPGPEQMDALADALDADETIRRRWDHLLEIAGNCNTLNLTNGAIIRMRKHQFDSSLAVLRGGGAETDTYGQHGTTSPAAGSRPIAEA